VNIDEFLICPAGAEDISSLVGRGKTVRRSAMMDVLYMGLALVFFGLSWAFVKLCERV
jgi:hypothetical protein